MPKKKQPSREPGPEDAPRLGEKAVADERLELSRYCVLMAGNFSSPGKVLPVLCGLGVRVRVVAESPAKVRERIAALGVDEAVFVDTAESLSYETFRRYASADLIVLDGEAAGLLETMLRPWLLEEAAGSLQPMLPLVRLDDPDLRFVRTGKRWGYYLVGRALGLGPVKAREFMEECCGYEKENS